MNQQQIQPAFITADMVTFNSQKPLHTQSEQRIFVSDVFDIPDFDIPIQQPQQQQQQQPDAYQPNNRYSGKGNQSSFSFGDEKPQVAPASASGGRAQSSQQHSQQQSQLQQQLHTQQNQWDRPQQQQQQPQLGALSCHDGRGGMSSGKPSTKVHAPPGGKSSFSFY